MTEPPNTEALLATVREALRVNAAAHLVQGHAVDERPLAALDAIASELKAERIARQGTLAELERVRQAELNEHGRYVLTSGQLDEAEAQVDTLQRLAERASDALKAAEAALQHEREVVRELSRQIDPLAERAGLGVRHATAQRMDADFTLQRRAEAAEAELERVRAERDEARSIADGMARAPYGEFEKMREQRDTAQARLDRAVAALREAPIAGCVGIGCSCPRCAALAEMEESG